uniref:Uncharacterized protein n=1 Tax=Arundo donax TaxID=35708 RepID=A0A0A9H5A2_ARUDO
MAKDHSQTKESHNMQISSLQKVRPSENAWFKNKTKSDTLSEPKANN